MEVRVRDEAELMRASRQDPAAFREVYDRYAEQIYGFVLRRTGDPHAAHDLTAETFAQAWLSRRRFRDRVGGLAGLWLYGIARNVIATAARSRNLAYDEVAAALATTPGAARVRVARGLGRLRRR